MGFSAIQTITLRAPQWASDPRINDFILLAQQGLSSTVFGTRYGEAVGLKVLHMLACEARSGGNPGTGNDSGVGMAGAVASESEGSLSRTYAVSSSNQDESASWDDLNSTQYGKELKGLIRSVSFGPRTRMM
jgi:hypothetical protein